MDILIYALIAAFLAWRLYTILGQRHEDPRERSNPFAVRPDARQGSSASGQRNKPGPADAEDVLPRLPPPDDEEDPSAAFRAEPAPESLAGGLYAIRRADPSFEEKSFLKGARVAFEMIVHAFVAGERGTLKNLMAPAVLASFEKALDDREARRERWEMPILNLCEADIVSARMVGGIAFVGVLFVSDQQKRVYDRDGKMLDSASAVERLTDQWVFRRDTRDSNPNWQLVETRSL